MLHKKLDRPDSLHYKVQMEQDWAAEHLQVIRTLMERSAIYRRALAPIMTFAGLIGMAAAAVAYFGSIHSVRGFILFWGAVSVIVLAGTFLLVRRQAIKDQEPLWSPPTRRVSQALVPCLFVGALTGLIFWLGFPPETDASDVKVLSPIWIILYGCALHSAGFFMTRGIKLFGWAFILAGSALIFVLPKLAFPLSPHWLMGFFFGVLHLAYGTYLYFTEQRRNAA
jgi:hypothetical protein